MIGTQKNTCLYTWSVFQYLFLHLSPYLTLFFSFLYTLYLTFTVWLVLVDLSICAIALLVGYLVYCVSQVLFYIPVIRTHTSVSVCVQAKVCSVSLCVYVLHTHSSINCSVNPISVYPCLHFLSHLFCLLNCFSSSALFFHIVLKEQTHKECDNRGISQMHAELAWLAQSVCGFYTLKSGWMGLLLPKKHSDWGEFFWDLVTWIHVSCPGPHLSRQFFHFPKPLIWIGCPFIVPTNLNWMPLHCLNDLGEGTMARQRSPSLAEWDSPFWT